MALTTAEISADRARAVELFGPMGEVGHFGQRANAAGDLDGDGLDDFAISAPNENSNAGAVYLVFGRSAAEWESATFDFSAEQPPNASGWVRISGASGSYLGQTGLDHGDFNGDGLSDLIFSTYNSGKVFCVFGRGGGWSSFSTADIESGNVPGLAISSELVFQIYTGNSGDMNGDGIDDLFVSSEAAKTVFVIFGAPGTRGTFNISTIDGTNGFKLRDEATFFGSTHGMGSVGDVNGDGLADLGISSHFSSDGAGHAYIIFARNVSASGPLWPELFNLTSDLDGANGFFVKGPTIHSRLGYSVVGAGDVNADGFADVFIGSSGLSGSFGASAWIVLGHPAPFPLPILASQLNGTAGFHFYTGSAEYWGCSGGGAGDINGDGFDDLIIGGFQARNSSGTNTGAAVLIFGRAGSWPDEISSKDAVGSLGFLVDGPGVGSKFGSSARGAGDVNGDGLADFIVGAYGDNSDGGSVTLVFGDADHCAECSNTTDACLVCNNGYFLNGTFCEANETAESSLAFVSSSCNKLASSETSSAHQQGVSVIVIIKFLEDVTDPTELEEEIASALGINAGLVSVVAISPTEVEVTIIGSEETAQRLVDIINGGAGSDGSGLGLLRKAIDAHIRKDTDGDGSSDDDGVDAAPRASVPQIAFVFTTLMPLYHLF